ncbi:hypothetical protein KUCAC02_007098, partial [Chaenocephalus aceratus]
NGRESQQLGANGGSLRGTQKQEAVFAEVKGNVATSQDKIRKRKEVIRDIWAGRRRETLWAKYGPYKIYSQSVGLGPGEELEGEIVNAYLAWVGAKAGVFIGLLPNDFPLARNPQGKLKKAVLSALSEDGETSPLSYPEGSTKKEQYVMTRRADTFRIKGANRIKLSTLPKWSPAEEADHVFEEFHCSNIGGLWSGEDSLCSHSSVLLAWHGGLLSVHRANIKEKLECSPIEVMEPLELVGMDLVGKPTVNSGLCERLDIKRSLCSAYHPQTNGLVEKLNGTIQRLLNKMVAGHPKRWDQVLQSTMFGLRTKKQLTTKCSPYYFMFGREARYPSEVPEEYLVKEEKVSRLVEREEIHEGLKKPEAVFTEVKKQYEYKSGQAHKDTDAPPSMDGDAHMAPKDPERWRRTQTLWCKFGPSEVYSENIMDLAPGKWLEGEFVNSYVTMVGRKAGALLIDSYLMTSLSGRETTKLLELLYLLKHDVAVGAVCHHGH